MTRTTSNEFWAYHTIIAGPSHFVLIVSGNSLSQDYFLPGFVTLESIQLDQ